MRASLLFLFSLSLCAVLQTSALSSTLGGLVDDPIHGDANIVQYLDGEGWQASNGNVTIGARVPGDLITDLQSAYLIGDPLFGTNFQSTLWDTSSWNYTTTFDLSPDLVASYQNGAGIWLVFDSLKMAGDIYLNGVMLTNATNGFQDQFLRYSFEDIQSLLTITNNVLIVSFTTSSDIRNQDGRWMACSGAWDWAPYGSTFNTEKDHTFSKGIVRSVYLVPVSIAAITHIIPKITYTGAYPTTPLTDQTAAPFNVTVDVVLQASAGGTGAVTVVGDWAPSTPVTSQVNLQAGSGETVVTLVLPLASGVPLWWPLGARNITAQPLAALSTITVSFTPTSSSTSSIATRRIGFRTAYLVTADDSNPAILSKQTGSGNLTMRFKVNGADMQMRGANMIPIEEMEGRESASTYVALLHSAIAGRHNMLRIWGGGIYLPPVFYDVCSEQGIMLYHDVMYGTPWFGGSGGTPTANALQTSEIIHAIRRLSSHPSILLWDGGNENLGRWDDVTTSFLLPTITSVDMTRPVWPTSPSYGFTSGVNRLTGLPDGNPFVLPTKAQQTYTFETHGPYQHGAGFATVNGDKNLDLFSSNMPPALNSAASTTYGTTVGGVFASEFGCSAFSSFESMAPTLNPSDWSAHANAMVQRNYPTDNIVYVYFGEQAATMWLNDTGTKAFRAATYLATLGSALQQKSDIEVRRSGNQWAILRWQIGEIWPTGGWGSLEYATVGYTPGQVLGGRWKPLHHFLRDHLYNDQVFICGKDAACVIKNEDPLHAFAGVWTASFMKLSDGTTSVVGTGNVTLSQGGNSASWVCVSGPSGGNPVTGACASYASLLPLHGCAADATDCILMLSLTDSMNQNAVVDAHPVQLLPPGNMSIPSGVSVTALVATNANNDGSVNVIVKASGGVALYVTLTTLEQGWFSTNAFVLSPAAPSPMVVTLNPIVGATPIDPGRLATTLHIDHVGLYVQGV